MDRNAALILVYEAIDVLNGQRPAEEQLIKSPDLVFFSEESALDLLALTTLVLTVERKVREVTGKDIDLFGSGVVDEDMAALRSPASLADTILHKVS